jgi:hypothetical protein
VKSTNYEDSQFVRFEAFTASECNEVFSGDQLCDNGVSIQRFRDCLCLHYQGKQHGLRQDGVYLPPDSDTSPIGPLAAKDTKL